VVLWFTCFHGRARCRTVRMDALARKSNRVAEIVIHRLHPDGNRLRASGHSLVISGDCSKSVNTSRSVAPNKAIRDVGDNAEGGLVMKEFHLPHWTVGGGDTCIDGN